MVLLFFGVLMALLGVLLLLVCLLLLLLGLGVIGSLTANAEFLFLCDYMETALLYLRM